MDLLKAELAKKKAANEALKGKAAGVAGASRFVRRGDMLKAQEQARTAEIARMRQEEETKKRRREEEAANKLRSKPTLLLAHAGDNAAAAAAAAAPPKLSAKEVKARLREMGEPVTVFGETAEGRAARLGAAVAAHEHDDFQIGGGHEIKNQFLRQGSEGSIRTTDSNNHGDKDDDDDDKDDEKDDGPVSDYTYVRRFFKTLLKQWEEDLNARPEQVKGSIQGRRDTRTQKQSKDYLRPMFKLCKQHALNPGILANLVKMVNFMKEGEFVKAHDVYMLTAIGNAPWPIGLTMVGIHERSGREKIESRNVAHIMNNEAQRKYLVSIKRLMTWLQEKRTDVPPSKKVM
eukprot:TRINITY_DN85_c1_g3_i2.p2 TRINITY_DN85_c1_g3~~TRINITY_DN85_c1_g3_i2.p2  ORF type:complete len:346 (-),score=156.72 TRINITY_DN85_c1_g3_i2:776-1813(-)